MTTFALVAIAIAAIWKVVDGIKMLAPNLPPIVVQIIAWVVGVGMAFVMSWSDLGPAIAIANRTLENVNGWTVLLFGIGLGSSSSASVDFVKSIDQYRTSTPGGPDPVATTYTAPPATAPPPAVTA